MAFAAKLVRNVRASERYSVELDGTLRDEEWRPFDVIVLDLSAEGFRIPALIGLPLGSSISLGLPGIGPRSAVVVRHDAAEYGCQFTERLVADELSTAINAVAIAPVVLDLPRATAVGNSPAPARDRLTPRVRLAVLGILVSVTWAVLFGARLLLR